jgi:hypothetical protein
MNIYTRGLWFLTTIKKLYVHFYIQSLFTKPCEGGIFLTVDIVSELKMHEVFLSRKALNEIIKVNL